MFNPAIMTLHQIGLLVCSATNSSAFLISAHHRSFGLCRGSRPGCHANSSRPIIVRLTLPAFHHAQLTANPRPRSPGVAFRHLLPISPPDESIFGSDLRASLHLVFIGTITTPRAASCALVTRNHPPYSETG
jgi:hypothetical protein